MKMKKLLSLLLASAALATGCASVETSADIETKDTDTQTIVIDTVETNEADAPAASPATEEAALTAEAPITEEIMTLPSAPAEDKKVFEAGTWLLYDGEAVPLGYCFIAEDGMSGKTLMYEDDSSVSFEYEIGINEVAAVSGGESVTVPIVGGDPSYVMLDIPDFGRVDMVYLSEATEADMPELYSNDELCTLALDYYNALTGYMPQCAEAETNADGTVSIHLYDSTETHIATCARYKVDRLSTEGWDDITGEEINFLHTLLQQGE